MYYSVQKTIIERNIALTNRSCVICKDNIVQLTVDKQPHMCSAIDEHNLV